MDIDAKYSDHEWKEGVKLAKKGYSQLDDFGTKLIKDEPKRAKMHFEISAKDFDSALKHFAKADVGMDGQKAIKEFDSGVDAFNKACNDIDQGNLDGAQSQYDKASEHFTKASDILG